MFIKHNKHDNKYNNNNNNRIKIYYKNNKNIYIF